MRAPSFVSTSSLLALGAALLLLAGCAGVPSQEMSDARVALDAARQANAGQHAPAAMSRADAALASATGALRSGDYNAARERAGVAREEAILARRLAALVAGIEEGIRSARAAGGRWEGASGLLAQAREASRAGDTERALAIAERARELIL